MDNTLKAQLLDLVVNSKSAKDTTLVLISPENITSIDVTDKPGFANNSEARIGLTSGYVHQIIYNREPIAHVIEKILAGDTVTIPEDGTAEDVISFLNSKGLAISELDVVVEIIDKRAVKLTTTKQSIRYNGGVFLALAYGEGELSPEPPEAPKTEFIDSVVYSETDNTVTILTRGLTSIHVEAPGQISTTVDVVNNSTVIPLTKRLEKGLVITVTGGNATPVSTVVDVVSTLSDFELNLTTSIATAKATGASAATITGPFDYMFIANVNVNGDILIDNLPRGVEYAVGQTFTLVTNGSDPKTLVITLTEAMLPKVTEPFVTDIHIDPVAGTISGIIKEGLEYVELYLDNIGGTGVVYPAFGETGYFELNYTFNIKDGDKLRFVNAASEEFEYTYESDEPWGVLMVNGEGGVTSLNTSAKSVGVIHCKFMSDNRVEDYPVAAGVGVLTLNRQPQDYHTDAIFYNDGFRLNVYIS